jgi:NAD(P)-dependent dehydrogenase (short-subunit alcohol dehydrogenase family)
MTAPLLAGRVVVVTGGSSGNGRAIALAAAEHGARAVIVADLQRDPREGGRPVVEEIADRGTTASRFVHCDVSDARSVDEAVACATEFGGIDVMVNNAGIVGPTSTVVDFDDAEFDRVLDVNLKGCFYGCRAAARVMVERGHGSIVNISSVAAVMASNSSSAYSASKAGVQLLTATLAAEVGPAGVRANAVLPGIIRTHMTAGADRSLTVGAAAVRMREIIPVRRVGEPHEVAGAVVYLASDLASFVNGSSLIVDGGMLSHLPT